MNRIFAQSTVWWSIFLLSAVVLGSALYAQYVLYMEPCPLCIFQRVAVMAVGALALVFALIGFVKPNRCVALLGNALISVAALVGLGIAAQHIYIQNLPEADIPACGPGLDYMIETMPFNDMVAKVLGGSGECASVEPIMGVPLPIWSALFFTGVLVWLWSSWFKNRPVK